MMTMERAKQARRACRWIAAWLLILSFALPAAAQTSLDADAAEALVRETWYEGLPVDRAAQIGAAGAYEAMAAWALLPRTGEVDRATFRAWQALPHALGQLAGRDRRALQLLASQLDAQPPGWRFRHHDSERIARLTRRGAASGLATSGLPEADALLRGAEARRHADPDFREHLREERRRLRERAEGSAR
jgi:hypothetical protein